MLLCVLAGVICRRKNKAYRFLIVGGLKANAMTECNGAMCWLACSGMSNPDCERALCVVNRDAMTWKACGFALRNGKKELLLLCGAEVSEMNGGEME